MIIFLDDDPNIHSIWEKRLEPLLGGKWCPKSRSITRPADLEQWLSENKDATKNTLFLIDYEYVGETISGLDLIGRYSIQERAVLVTNRFDESAIIQRCMRLGVGLLPIAQAMIVPIRKQNSTTPFS